MLWVLAGLGLVALGLAALILTVLDLDRDFRRALAEELASDATRPHPVLTEADIAALPTPVQRYVRRSGAVGRPRPASVLTTFDAALFSAPGAAPMRGRALQYDRFDPPRRLFYMETRMGGLPVKVLHSYAGIQAGMKVRLAGLVNVVDSAGEAFSRTETVTLLNDLCLLAPAWLTDPRLAWTPIDESRAEVTFTNTPHVVSARLEVSAEGDLVNFVSEDRGALQKNGSLLYRPWKTPVRDFKDFDGQRAFGHGEAIWEEPAGDFAYGLFETLSIQRH